MQGHSRSKKPTQGLGFKMQFSDKRHPGSWETGLVPGLGQGPMEDEPEPHCSSRKVRECSPHHKSGARQRDTHVNPKPPQSSGIARVVPTEAIANNTILRYNVKSKMYLPKSVWT